MLLLSLFCPFSMTVKWCAICHALGMRMMHCPCALGWYCVDSFFGCPSLFMLTCFDCQDQGCQIANWAEHGISCSQSQCMLHLQECVWELWLVLAKFCLVYDELVKNCFFC